MADLARTILDQAPCLTLKDLAVNGRDALAAGLSGAEIGRALNRLLDQVTEGSLPNGARNSIKALDRLNNAAA